MTSPDVQSQRPGTAARANGFTLLEVLVALSVFSLAVIAHLSLQTENVRTVGALETKLLGQLVAENVLAETLGTVEPPEPGRKQGEVALGGRDWLWDRRILGTDTPDLMRIEIAVRTKEGGREVAALSGFRRRR